MSKSKSRASEPRRSSGQPAHWDKPATTKPPKFYDGPTVAAGSKSKSPVESGKIVVGTRQPVVVKQNQIATRSSTRRKKWTLTSFIAFIPFLLFASLFSTVLCPPSTAQPSSWFSGTALSSLGFAKSHSEHSQLHRTLCYPANVYHRDILVPYVYPVIENTKARLQAHPVYTKVEPEINRASRIAARLYNGPIKRVVDDTTRVVQKLHLTYIQPHVPFVKAKFVEATAPATLRAKELHKLHVAPHYKALKARLCAIAKWIKATYRNVVSHPISKQAHKHGQHAFNLGKHHGYRSYLASRPHAIRAWNEGRRHTRDTVIPRAVEGLHFVSNQIARVWLIVKGNACELYNKHAAQHLDPYVQKAQVALAPYWKLVNDKVYRPYIFPLIASIVPIPEKPKTFWEMISDILPSPGATNVGDRGSSFYADNKKQPAAEKAKKVAKEAVKEATKPKEDIKAKVEAVKEKAKEAVKEKIAPDASSVTEIYKARTKSINTKASTESVKAKAAAESVKSKIVDSAKAAGEYVVAEEIQKPLVASHGSTAAGTHSATATPASASTAVDEATVKAELVKKVATYKKQVEFQGKAIYARVQGEVVKNGEHFIYLIPELLRMGNENLQREIGRMSGGLEKLYTNSKSLTVKQVEESQQMANNKVQKALNQVTAGIKTSKNNIYKKTEPAVEQAQKDIENFLGEDYVALGKRLALVDPSQQEWKVYHSIKKDVEDWKVKIAEAPTKTSTKQLKDVTHKVEVGAAEVLNEFNEVFSGWKERLEQLRRNALDRIEARLAVEAEAGAGAKKVQAEVPRAKPSASKSADSGRVSILPIAEDQGAAAGDGDPVIGKSKEQIVQALKQADQIAKESAASFSKSADAGRVTIQPIADEDPAAVREGTPLLGKGKKQVEEALNQAKEAAESATQAAKDEL